MQLLNKRHCYKNYKYKYCEDGIKECYLPKASVFNNQIYQLLDTFMTCNIFLKCKQKKEFIISIIEFPTSRELVINLYHMNDDITQAHHSAFYYKDILICNINVENRKYNSKLFNTNEDSLILIKTNSPINRNKFKYPLKIGDYVGIGIYDKFSMLHATEVENNYKITYLSCDYNIYNDTTFISTGYSPR